MHSDRVDTVIRYALAVARCVHDEWRLQQLGRIHLIKYVYLADLAHAEREGRSYTEAPWVFFHFGPWSPEVHARVEPALKAPGIERRSIPSAYDADDYERWCIRNRDDAESVRSDAERQLPLHVAARVRQAVKEYGSATSDLLHHVYGTLPMRTAAPREPLNLTAVAEPRTAYGSEPVTPVELRPKAAKLRKQALEEARARFRERARHLLERETSILPAEPRYDEVFERGLAELDRMTGPSAEGLSGELEFDEEVWHAPTRTIDPDD